MHNRVYLAGPISGMTFTDAYDWRQHVKDKLSEQGIKVFSPMRREEYLKEHQLMPNAPDVYENVPIKPEAIVVRDRFDTMHCDVVIMNLLPSHSKVSIGTMIEAGWADAFRKILIIVMNESNVHNHPMLRGLAGYIVSSVDEAITLAASILLT